MTLPPILQGKAKYPVTEVILHTSATTGDWCKGKTVTQMRDEITLWHMRDNGWRDIGYHFVIAPSGDIATGRATTDIGAHVKNHNRGTIGICMVPVVTIDKMGEFADFYTQSQRKAVLKIIQDLGGITLVSGHNAYANKLCPGFVVRREDWL